MTRDSVFVSYRRTDTHDFTNALVAELRRTLAPLAVFQDIRSIPNGVPFDAAVERALQRAGVFVVVIGPNWLSPRLSDPKDWVRAEVLHALQHGQVVPVLHTPHDALPTRMPEADALPEELGELLRYQAIEVRTSTLETDTEVLARSIRFMVGPGGEVGTPIWAWAQFRQYASAYLATLGAYVNPWYLATGSMAPPHPARMPALWFVAVSAVLFLCLGPRLGVGGALWIDTPWLGVPAEAYFTVMSWSWLGTVALLAVLAAAFVGKRGSLGRRVRDNVDKWLYITFGPVMLAELATWWTSATVARLGYGMQANLFSQLGFGMLELVLGAIMLALAVSIPIAYARTLVRQTGCLGFASVFAAALLLLCGGLGVSALISPLGHGAWVLGFGMGPTINLSEVVAVERLSYLARPPRAGEIVQTPAPEGSFLPLLERVIASENSTVRFEDGLVVAVNGMVQADSYGFVVEVGKPELDGLVFCRTFTGELTTGPDQVLVAPDNRCGDYLSLAVPRVLEHREVIGRVFATAIPVRGPIHQRRPACNRLFLLDVEPPIDPKEIPWSCAAVSSLQEGERLALTVTTMVGVPGNIVQTPEGPFRAWTLTVTGGSTTCGCRLDDSPDN